ncbi:hypothetical protein ACFPU0_03805 [Pseudomonas sp. GCM10022186]|uniref:hypothetical protein n=1 Tax=Pseudomonas sp. GCM10022186 TaxID=3252650 RepID=UPI003606EB05
MAELQAIAGTPARWEQVWPTLLLFVRVPFRPLDSQGAACVPMPPIKLKLLFLKTFYLLIFMALAQVVKRRLYTCKHPSKGFTSVKACLEPE